MIDSAWYDEMLILHENAPEILHDFCAKKAEELNVSLEYFMIEFV